MSCIMFESSLYSHVSPSTVMLSLYSSSYHFDISKIRQDICARNKKIIRHSVSFIGFSHEFHCSPDLRSPYLSQKPWNLQTDFAKALLNFRILVRMLEIFRKAFYDISKYLPWEAFQHAGKCSAVIKEYVTLILNSCLENVKSMKLFYLSWCDTLLFHFQIPSARMCGVWRLFLIFDDGFNY